MTYLIREKDYDFLKENMTTEDKYFIKSLLDEVLKYCAQNNLLIYGGFAIFKNMNMKNYFKSSYKSNNKCNLYISEYDYNDLDIYSDNICETLNDILKILNKNKNVFNILYKCAKHPNTYTVFINQQKLLDISSLAKELYDKVTFKVIKEVINNKQWNIRIVQPFITYIDLLSLFESPSQLFRFDKTLLKFINLQNMYPIIDVFDYEIYYDNITNFKFKIDNVNELINILNKLDLSDKNVNKANINKDNVKISNDYRSIKRNEFSKQSFKYIQNDDAFLINGIFCFYHYLEKYKIPFDFNINCLHELEIYTTNLLIIKDTIIEYLNRLNFIFEISEEFGWSNFSNNYLIIKIKGDNKFSIYIYNLSTLKNYILHNNIKFASLLFLKSHLLLKSNIYNKKNYKLYNKILFKLNKYNIPYEVDGNICLDFDERKNNENYLKIKPYDPSIEKPINVVLSENIEKEENK
jgi:hypothetical protein